MVSVVLCIFSQTLEDMSPYAQLLIIDFGPAFKTLQPHSLIRKLTEIKVSSFIVIIHSSTSCTQQLSA